MPITALTLALLPGFSEREVSEDFYTYDWTYIYSYI